MELKEHKALLAVLIVITLGLALLGIVWRKRDE